MASVLQCFARSLSAVVAVVLGATVAQAQDNSLGANVRARLGYSDNIGLTSAPQGESTTLTDITTGIDFNRRQQRLTASVNYELQAIFYAADHNSNQVFNTLNAQSEIGLILERLYLDVFAMNDQTIVDPTAPVSFNRLTFINNITDMQIWGMSPHIPINFGANVIGDVRYSDTHVSYDADTLSDSREQYATFELGNSNKRQGFSWHMYYNNERYEYDSPLPVQFQLFETELGIWTSPALRLFTTQGLESNYDLVQLNRVDPNAATPGLDEHYWYVGAEWRPSDRTMTQVSVGERQFGRSYNLEWTYKGAHSGLLFDYAEQPSSFLHEQLNSARNAGEIIPIDTPDGPQGNGYYLQKRMSVAYTLERDRSNAGVRAYRDERYDIVAATNDEHVLTESYRALEFSLGWHINAVSFLNWSAQLATRRSVINNVDDDINYITFVWSRQVGRASQFTAEVTREDSSARSGGTSYTSNQIIVGIERSFGQSGFGALPARFNGYMNGRR